MNRVLGGAFWLVLYLAIVLSPLGIMLLAPAPAPLGFWSELSMAVGFVSLAQLGLQFVLIARFRAVTEPYGIDVILHYHRQIGFASLLLVIAHAGIAIATTPGLLAITSLATPSQVILATGVATLAALLVLIVLSVARQRLRVRYEAWRVGHALLGLAMLGLGLAHVIASGRIVNAPWKVAFWSLFLALMATVLVYLRLLRPLLDAREPYRVTRVEKDRGRTWVLTVEPDGHRGIRFLPGQFVWLKLGSSPLTLQEHPFSFSSSAETPDRLDFAIKELGDFTSAIGSVPSGTRAFLDGPHGSLSIDRYPAAGYVFIAGGVGVTPIVSMLRTMADRDDRRPCLLIYADSDHESMPLRDAVEALQGRLALEIVWVVERPPTGWQGDIGRVDRALLARRLPAERIRREFFICGPNPMIDAVEHALLELGIASKFIHSERFNLV